eukprot:TRINITY_DN4363_c0_g2_i1.p1 TRINITY_DN4363_c0_g2~~TRINITY_DN4363_c0_g2_i1.p1  ORF type:complete len:136 (-),score=10.53 TRINITY_DN4363_c0_g2_i1:2012-2419(-)
MGLSPLASRDSLASTLLLLKQRAFRGFRKRVEDKDGGSRTSFPSCNLGREESVSVRALRLPSRASLEAGGKPGAPTESENVAGPLPFVVLKVVPTVSVSLESSHRFLKSFSVLLHLRGAAVSRLAWLACHEGGWC